MKKLIPIISTLISSMVFVCFIWTMWFNVLPIKALCVTVLGRSMEPTLHNEQVIYGELGKIERGDITTICIQSELANQYPDLADGGIVKRIIGVPGDDITLEDNVIFVNGIALEEPYLSDEARKHTMDYTNYTDLQLKAGEYFVLGDNRGHSLDSRTFGPISEGNLLYKQSTTATWSTVFIVGLMLLTTIIGTCFYFGCYIITKKLLKRIL